MNSTGSDKTKFVEQAIVYSSHTIFFTRKDKIYKRSFIHSVEPSEHCLEAKRIFPRSYSLLTKLSQPLRSIKFLHVIAPF